ncbi:MAG: DNA-3-methyladenine glycosylase 2 family protein [Clostridia bacterium]|nr:DNA-3-methyladenine glycosylase 2 family protein [Clostridia bacterium]
MIKLYNIDHLSLDETFLCGQCFRWEKDENGVFWGVVKNHAAKMYYHDENTIYLESSNPDLIFWSRYLSFSSDYNVIEETLWKNELLRPSIERGRGIRILRQDLWETIVTFIISANNNIPRIKKIVSALCENFGEKIEFDGKTFFGFPTPEALAKLTVDDLKIIRAGFRDKYILDAAKKVASGETSLDAIQTMSDKDAKKELMKINGIGSKVADCVLLFALGRYKTFPQDVWIKRILADLYGVDEKDIPSFAEKTFGNFGGVAQQYLYYYYAIEKENIAI